MAKRQKLSVSVLSAFLSFAFLPGSEAHTRLSSYLPKVIFGFEVVFQCSVYVWRSVIVKHWLCRTMSITLLAMNIPVISQKLEGGHASGWKDVQPHDPQVQDAANHAVKSLQQKSNSLFPYELQEIVHAKAENASPEKSKGGKDVETVEAGPSSSKDASSKKSTCGNDAETSGAGPLSKVAYVENDPSGESEVETSGPVPSSLSEVFLPCPNLEAMSRTLQSKDDLPSMFFL